MTKIRVILGDDHGIVREGLVALLQLEEDIQVIGEAQNGAELLQLVRKLKPDVVVVDISMPILNGIEVVTRLSADPLPCKLLCLTMHKETHKVVAALDAGASGYVIKDSSHKELVRAIRSVMANQVFLSGELIGTVLQHCRHPTALPATFAVPRLTNREREVAQLLSEGHSTKAIARRLYVSAKTIATHREHIFEKLGIHSIAELTRYIVEEGLGVESSD
jgi:DNA-binding NarL/FixJ family response regulator